MQVAVLTFEGFNELDSFIAAAMINRVEKLEALIVCPTEQVASMNGVVVHSQAPLGFGVEPERHAEQGDLRHLQYSILWYVQPIEAPPRLTAQKK